MIQQECGSTSIKTVFGLFMAACFIILLLFMAVISPHAPNQSHADTKHAEDPDLRSMFWSNKDSTVEFYFSVVHGTVLALFPMGDGSSRYGGIIWRVTENMGTIWLGENAYECTAFIGTFRYWQNVLSRDGYMPLIGYPNIASAYFTWIASQFQ